jgi:hypothetical protein
VLQQDAVVVGQVAEEGAKPIRCSLHSGDLGDHDDAPGQAGFPGTFRRLQPPRPPDIPGNASKPKGEPRKYHD